MEINSAKSIILATLFIVTFLSCLLPLKLVDTIRNVVDPVKKLRYQRVMSLLNCFAGGVFLGTCLLDLFPEVQDSLGDVISKLGIVTSFPCAEFLVVIGLFLVLIVEQISLDCKYPPTRLQVMEEREPLLQDASANAHEGSIVNYGSTSSNEPHDHHELPVNSSLRSLLLLVALSLHSIFEGLAIGLQENVEEVLQIFAAVVLHKCVIAFGLSLNLVQSNLKTSVVVQLTLVFCLAAPIGLGIGMGVMEVSNSLEAAVLSGILQGLACGTFLYVTFFEVLPHELNSSDMRTPKMLFIIFGFAASCAIVFLDPDTSRPKCPN
nr:EOG090X0EEU [Ilyocryptus agilis]